MDGWSTGANELEKEVVVTETDADGWTNGTLSEVGAVTSTRASECLVI